MTPHKNPREKQRNLAVFFAYAWICFLTWFFRAADFGLYGEDFYRVGPAMTLSFLQVLKVIASSFSHMGGYVFGYPIEGRPLHNSLLVLLSWVGTRGTNPLLGLYAIAFFINLQNAWLLRGLVRRISSEGRLADLTGLVFLLYPADTTKAWLTSAFGIQTAVSFLLLSFYLYLHRRKLAAYVLMGISLLLYETPFPVFFVAPVLQRRGVERREMAVHGLSMVAVLAVVVGLRRMVGEQRLGSAAPLVSALTLMKQSVVGPIVSMGQFVHRSLTGYLHLDIVSFFAMLPLGGALYFTIRALQNDSQPVPRLRLRYLLRRSGQEFPMVLGFSMLVLGYVLALYPPATSLGGRFARVHTAGALGGSMFVAALVVRLSRTYRGVGLRCAVPGLFMGLVAFGHVVQRDFVRDWLEEKAFWTEIDSYAHALGDGDVILVPGDPVNRAADDRFMGGIGYTHLQAVFRNLHRYPRSFKDAPLVARVGSDWAAAVRMRDGQIDLSPIAWEGVDRRVTPEHLLILEVHDDRLRRKQAWSFGGKKMHLLEPKTPASHPQETALHRLLIDPGRPRIAYLRAGASTGYFF